MRGVSTLLTSTVPVSRRVWCDDFFSRLWRSPACWATIFPRPVTLTRLPMPVWLFIFGIECVLLVRAARYRRRGAPPGGLLWTAGNRAPLARRPCDPGSTPLLRGRLGTGGLALVRQALALLGRHAAAGRGLGLGA